ncbi:hypothetical protein, partial [Fusobacterium sp.]|uniref:hypothetical protein n=1 Tax=Fusobacterium sp. TaxID=68766 RepID=UPI00262C79D3
MGFLMVAIYIIAIICGFRHKRNKRKKEEEKEIQYELLKDNILKELKLENLKIFSNFDTEKIVKSRQALENYDSIKFFKENKGMFEKVEEILKNKKNIAKTLKKFLENNNYMNNPQYYRVKEELNKALTKTGAYIIKVDYISSNGNNLGSKKIIITQQKIEQYKEDLSLIMTKSEYNKLIKEEQKKVLIEKQKKYYDIVNEIIDYVDMNKDSLIIKESRKNLDDLIGKLFDRTVNSIKKIKSIDSEEWIL